MSRILRTFDYLYLQPCPQIFFLSIMKNGAVKVNHRAMDNELKRGKSGSDELISFRQKKWPNKIDKKIHLFSAGPENQ